MIEENKALFNWKFEDKKERSSLWYIIAISVVIGLVIWGFLTKQYGMSFMFMLLAGIVFYVENNAEDEIAVTITELGIKVSEKFYDYSRISSFCFIFDGDQAIFLKFQVKQRGIPPIQVKVNTSQTLSIRPILGQFIEEKSQENIGFLDRVIHLLKL